VPNGPFVDVTSTTNALLLRGIGRLGRHGVRIRASTN
jgi:hypothetical protein